MSLSKTYIATRHGSTNFQFRMRVPTAAMSLRGQSRLIYLDDQPPLTTTTTFSDVVSFSLKTKSEDVAKRRDMAARRHLESIFSTAASGPARLDYRQLVALSGQVYRLHVDLHEANPGQPFQWRAAKALHRAVLEGRIIHAPTFSIEKLPDDATMVAKLFGDDLTAAINVLPVGDNAAALEGRFGQLADFVLDQHAIKLAAEDRQTFLRLVASAAIDAGYRLKRAAGGDFSPDPKADRFPSIDTVVKREKTTVTSLLDDWWKEASATGRKIATYKAYGISIRAFVAFIKHDDAHRVTGLDVIRFKDHRLASGRSAKAVKDTDIVALKSVFGWGVDNKKLASNPADGVKIRVGRKQRLRDPGFTDDEAITILKAATAYKPAPMERPKMTAAIRWLPWLMAYSGARVNELVQLRAVDIVKDSGIDCLRITPEAGDVKSNQFRIIPLHQHPIEQGFLKYAQSCKGNLFAKSAGKRVAEFVREIVPDENVAPNHGWRHRLKTTARDLGIDPRVTDAIQGHAPKSASDNYGDVSTRAKATAINKFPKYKIENKPELESPGAR